MTISIKWNSIKWSFAKLQTATFSICFNFSFVRWASCIFSYISSNKFFCNSVDKQTQKQRDKQIQIKETNRHKTKRQTDKQTHILTDNRQLYKHTYKQTTRLADMPKIKEISQGDNNFLLFTSFLFTSKYTNYEYTYSYYIIIWWQLSSYAWHLGDMIGKT